MVSVISAAAPQILSPGVTDYRKDSKAWTLFTRCFFIRIGDDDEEEEEEEKEGEDERG